MNVRAETYLKGEHTALERERTVTFTYVPEEKLQTSEYGNDDDLKSMLDYFDAATKPVFKNENEPSYIKFGSMKCNDPAVNIRRGQLTLAGYVPQSIPACIFVYNACGMDCAPRTPDPTCCRSSSRLWMQSLKL